MDYYVIDKTCIMCGRCAKQCPLEAISEGEEQYVIDSEQCVGCGVCARSCPIEAIKEAE